MARKTANVLFAMQSAKDVDDLINDVRQQICAIRPRHIQTEEELAIAFGERIWDLMIFQAALTGFPPAAALKAIRVSERDIPLIVICHDENQLQSSRVLEAVKAGAVEAINARERPGVITAIKRELGHLANRRALRRVRSSLSALETQYRWLLDRSPEPTALAREGRVLYANKRFAAFFGHDNPQALWGMMLSELMAEGHQDSMRIRDVVFDGLPCKQVSVRQSDSGGEVGAGSIFDAATGLFTRNYFLRRVATALKEVPEKKYCLIYFEILEFDRVRSAVGLASSDMLLKEVADLILGALPDDSPISRCGDCSFAVLVANQTIDYCIEQAAFLRRSVQAQVFHVGGNSLSVECLVGVSVTSTNLKSETELFEQAYLACRQSGEGQSSGVHVYSEPLTGILDGTGQWDLRAAVQEGLTKDRFSLLFQPVMSLQSTPVELYEVLLRLEDDQGQPIPADVFIPFAIEQKMIADIDRWIIEKAVQTLHGRKESGHNTQFLVKLSRDGIKDVETPITLQRLLKKHGVSGDQIIIEVSESATGNLKETQAFLGGLKDAKVRSALEHFGVGLNSFGLLDHLPVEFLKIDASLISDLSRDAGSLQHVKRIAQEARATGRYTIAECLEDAQSLAALFSAGVDFAQGYYVQPPSQVMEFNFTDEVI